MKKDQLSSLATRAAEFRRERDWSKFDNPKDLALSLVLEATEVLELTQWKDGEDLQEHLRKRKSELADELADTLYWVLVLAQTQGIDIAEAFEAKMKKNEAKYPVEKVKGKAVKYTEL